MLFKMHFKHTAVYSTRWVLDTELETLTQKNVIFMKPLP